MTQLDYVERKLEPRDSGLDSAAALLNGLACGLGVVALWFAPMVIGFFAIGFAIIGLAISGDRNRFGKIALIIATVGWLVGSMIAVFTGNSPISINLA
jgi:cytochrome c oxidase assembly factor CtaG